MNRNVACPLLLAMTMALAAGSAHAQTWPTRPITVVNASTPGGGGDLIARILSGPFQKELGQPMVISNKTGASGNIAMEAVGRATPDGYTLLIGFTGHVINPGLFKNPPVDAVKDFTPISLIATNTTVLSVRAGLAAKNVQELLSMARATPGKLTMSYYAGTSQHLAAELFNTMAGIKVLSVPYKGSQEAMNDVLAGRIDYVFSTLSTAQPGVQAGTARILGVTDPKRSVLIPDVPPLADTVPGYASRGWYGLLGPANLPRPIVDRLNTAVAHALQQEDVKQKLLGSGSEPLGSTPEQFAEFIRTEIPKWSKVIRDAGITPQ